MPTAKKPTERDLMVLAAVTTLLKRREFAPSFREVCDESGLAYSTVQNCLRRLQRFGRISRERGVARSLSLAGSLRRAS